MNLQPSCDHAGNITYVMAEKQNGRGLVCEHSCVGQSHVPIWKAHLGVLCVREINFYVLYIPMVLLLEKLTFTLANTGLFLLLVCLYLKRRRWHMLLCDACDKHTVLKLILAG